MKHFDHKLTRLVQFLTYFSTSFGDNFIDYFDDLVNDDILDPPDDSKVSNNFLFELAGSVRKVRDDMFESLLFLEDMIEVCQDQFLIDGSQVSIDACLRRQVKTSDILLKFALEIDHFDLFKAVQLLQTVRKVSIMTYRNA